jgi:hypothetical protein
MAPIHQAIDARRATGVHGRRVETCKSFCPRAGTIERGNLPQSMQEQPEAVTYA